MICMLLVLFTVGFCIFSISAPGVPVLLVLFTAGPINVTFAESDDAVNAILQCFFPAQATGDALFNVVTMATANSSPAGRLPYTWYNTSDQVRGYEK